MAINALSLPVDIPWKRLCVSEDMIDTKVCDRTSPPRWKSSVAVFSYEPTEDYQTYEGMTISYLKVVCTVTGYEAGEEVDLKDLGTDLDWQDEPVKMSSKYYGCYGAILEVAVAPKKSQGEEVPPSKYPYIIDFEPKKREVYEIVSDTGEQLSRSLENINVRKGNTTTQSHEFSDILNTIDWSASAQGPKGGGSGSSQVSGQWGS